SVAPRTTTSRFRSTWARPSAAVVLALLTAVPLAWAAPTLETTDLSLYHGRWRPIDLERDEAERLEAIDRAVDDLSWVMRKMARRVLRGSTKPPVEIGFSWDGAQLLLRQKRRANDERTTAVVLRDPPAADEPRDGDWYWADGGLRGSWVRSEARGSSSYRLDPISETLLVEQRIEITALDGVEPIVFELRFGRAERPELRAVEVSKALQSR
ncbi:MAG: hypothetical protein JRF61_02240, partial [Deltaproteobacteria bacterium]|nr:hypothetical protein [Deltaproteobacteria bacterium]